MNVKHELRIECRCPVDPELMDEYELEVATARTIPVEFILATVAELTAEPAYQEDLTSRLALALLCKVTTWGTHSGVRTMVEAFP